MWQRGGGNVTNNRIENYQCEEREVLEASVEVCLFLELDNHLKMRVVYVRVHPEEALEDRLDDITEVGRERNPCWHHNVEPNTTWSDHKVPNNQNAVFQCSYGTKSQLPSFRGNMVSSSSWVSIQSIRYSTYFGADTSIGLLILAPSAHLYS